MSALRGRRCWRTLSSHHDDVKPLQLRELLAADPRRGERFAAEGADYRRPEPVHPAVTATASALTVTARGRSSSSTLDRIE